MCPVRGIHVFLLTLGSILVGDINGQIPPLNLFDIFNVDVQSMIAKLSNKMERASSLAYKVELFIVADYSIYKRWYEKTDGINATDRQKLAEGIIEQYIGTLLNTVNLAYKELLPYGINIQIVPVAVMVTTSPSQSPWTETSKVKGFPRDTIEPIGVLKKFEELSKRVQSAIPHDHAMLLTGYDIKSKAGDRNLTGYANIGSACTERSVSVVEDSKYIFTAQTMAHEIGHSLGCEHDGDGNSCPASDGLLMAPDFEDENMDKTWKWIFSSCSRNYIVNHFRQMSRLGMRCLLQQNNPKPFQYLAELASQQYGKVYSADQQCKIKYDRGSYVCRAIYENDYTNICTELKCYTTKDNLCHFIDAGDGTVCGRGKICKLGNCIAGSAPQNATDSCPIGDRGGEVKDGMTCEQLISKRPQECYDKFYQQTCCASCEKYAGLLTGVNTTADAQCVERFGQGSYVCRTATIYDNGPYSNKVCGQLMCNDPAKKNWCKGMIAADGTPCGYKKWCQQKHCVYSNQALPVPDDCPFGDRPGVIEKGLSCREMSRQTPYRCYDSWVQRVCCKTCAEIKTGATGCEYGDKSPWCRESFKNETDRFLCYQGTEKVKNAELCCATCAKYHNPGRVGCEYGDKSHWCATAFTSASKSYLCYQGTSTVNNSDLCCDTCSKYYDSRKPDCRYGDRSSWCREHIRNATEASACYYGKNENLCCETCQKYKNSLSPGCAYGDKDPTCSVQKCPRYDEKSRTDICCETCKFYVPPVLG